MNEPIVNKETTETTETNDYKGRKQGWEKIQIEVLLWGHEEV